MQRQILSLLTASTVLLGAARAFPGEPFLRGDANSDGKVDISDMKFILDFLFVGGRAPACSDAADVNDDGAVVISDPIFGLNFLFLGERAPPAPGTTVPGFDLTTNDPFECGDAGIDIVIAPGVPIPGFGTTSLGDLLLGLTTLLGDGRGLIVDLLSGRTLSEFITGDNPGILRISPASPAAFVVNRGTPADPEESVTWVSFANPRIPATKTLKLSGNAFDVQFPIKGDIAIALIAGTAEKPAEDVAFLDAKAGAISSVLKIGLRPTRAVFSPNGAQALVVGEAQDLDHPGSYNTGAAVLIDMANQKVIRSARFDDLSLPLDAVFLSNGFLVCDGAGSAGSIQKLDTNLKVTARTGHGFISEIVVTPDGSRGFALSRQGNFVQVINVTTMQRTKSIQLDELDADPAASPTRPERRLLMTADGNTVLIGSPHGHIVGIDVKTSSPLGETSFDLRELGVTVEEISIRAKSEELYVPASDGNVYRFLISKIDWHKLIDFPWKGIGLLTSRIPIAGTVCSQDIVVLEDTPLSEGSIPLFVDDANQERLDKVARRFYADFPDIYDFVVVFYGSEFGDVTSPGAFAFSKPTSNFTRGLNRNLGRGRFGTSDLFSDLELSRLSNLMWENDLNEYDDDLKCRNRPPNEFGELRDGVSILAQEVLHRWAASIDVAGEPCGFLRDGFHYAQFFNSDGSVVGGPDGFRIRDNGDGSFTWTTVESAIPDFDEYMMGLLSADEVAQELFCVDDAVLTDTLDFTGNRVDFTMTDITTPNGNRIPAAPLAQKQFNMAFVLAVPNGDTFPRADLNKMVKFREKFTELFEQETQGRGRLNTRVCPLPFTTTIKEVSVGSSPVNVAVSPNGLWAYVANFASSSVSVIDADPSSASFNTVLGTIPVGPAPASIAFLNDSSRAFVVIRDSDRVDVINTATRTVIDDIPVGNEPIDILIDAGGSAFVTNRAADTASILNLGSLSATSTLTLGDRPQGIAGTLDRHVALFVNRTAGTITVRNRESSSSSTLTIESGPLDIAVVQSEMLPNQTVTRAQNSASPPSIAYVTHHELNKVTVLDIVTNPATNAASVSVLTSIPVGAGPGGVAFQPGGAIALVSNFDDSTVSVIEVSRHQVIATVNTAEAPDGIAFSPDGKRAYVCQSHDGSVRVLE